MYHNVVSDFRKPNQYAVTSKMLRGDFDILREKGYNVVGLNTVIKCCEQGVPLPERAVLITFDDGFLSAVRYAQPLLQEYGYTAVVAIVGEYAAYGKSNPAAGGENGVYMEWDDIEKADKSGVFEWAYHSDRFHHITKKRTGVQSVKGEDADSYRRLFIDDTLALKSKFALCGIEPLAYAYPFGAFCDQSEEILEDLGVGVTFTCTYGLNRIYAERSLRLLLRVNRDGDKPFAQALKYFETET